MIQEMQGREWNGECISPIQTMRKSLDLSLLPTRHILGAFFFLRKCRLLGLRFSGLSIVSGRDNEGGIPQPSVMHPF